MSISKPRVEVRIPRRSPKLCVELLEDRLQPGSVLPGFSLLGSSLADLDAGVATSGDEAAQIIHDQPDRPDGPTVFANLLLSSSKSTGNSNGAGTSGSAAPVDQHNSASNTAPPLTLDLPALETGSIHLAGLPDSGQPTASGTALLPAASPGAGALKPLSPGNIAVVNPTLTQAQGLPHLAAPAAVAAPLPAGSLHHLTASVVTQVNAGGQGEIHPDASVNWTTLVTGTSGTGTGRGVAVDSSGNIFTTGYTDDGTTKMAFVAEHNSSGSRLAFTAFQVQDPSLTYIQSEGHAIAVANVNGTESIYVVGKATDALEGDTDAFIMQFQFDANNNLTPVPGYANGIGGPFNDSGEGVALDSAGEATMVGSYGISPTLTNIFAVKLTADGSNIIFASSYSIPGSDSSSGNAIALDSTMDNAYLAGSILVTGGDNDILVMQIDNTGGSVVYTATMVNPGDDALNGIAVDPTGDAYVAGTLASSGTTQAFVAELSPDGKSILAQTPLTIGRTGTGMSQDPSTGNIYVVGAAPDAANNSHVFVEKLDGGLNPHDLTVLSGSGTETGSGIAYDPGSGNAYVVGTTSSSDLPTDDSTLNGTSDAFLSNVGSFN